MTEEEISEASEEAQVVKNQGDRWTFVAVLPESSYIQTTHHGARTLEQAEAFVAKIKSKSDGQASYFASDSWLYEQALANNYCEWEAVPYKGRGRRPHLIQLLTRSYAMHKYIRSETARVV